LLGVRVRPTGKNDTILTSDEKDDDAGDLGQYDGPFIRRRTHNWHQDDDVCDGEPKRVEETSKNRSAEAAGSR
jgi:hypothetical protein